MDKLAKPHAASAYRPEWTERTRRLCLFVATRLGDLMTEDVVVIGGLVPGLLIDQEDLPAGADPHVGTIDLDVGLSLTLLTESRYREVSQRLRNAGFVPDETESGAITRQRWLFREAGTPMTIDFLIPPPDERAVAGRLQDLDQDFAAIITEGLELAFVDREIRRIEGRTVLGERAVRDIPVCGPAAFVVLKAIAFDGRGENKDAYDLYYVVRNYGRGPEEVAERLQPYLGNSAVRRAVQIIGRDFSDDNQVGTLRAAEFLDSMGAQDLRADIVGFFMRLLKQLHPKP